MRVRTILTWCTGAAMGAAGAWLLDPEQGPERRRTALMDGFRRGRDVDWVGLAQRSGAVATELGRRAAEGYREGVEET
jgi:gas vesicle protein